MKTKLTVTIFENCGEAAAINKYYNEHLSLSVGTGVIIGGRDSVIGAVFFNTQTDIIQYLCKHIDVTKDDYGDFLIKLAMEGWTFE